MTLATGARLRRLVIAAPILCSGLFTEVATGLASTYAAGSCFGSLAVTPHTAHIGQVIHLHGAHFSCTSPDGKLLPSATVFLYQYRKDGGFQTYTVRVNPRGNYKATVQIPRRLRANTAIYTGANHFIATRPGRYYLAIRLFDVDLTPPRQALAQISIVR